MVLGAKKRLDIISEKDKLPAVMLSLEKFKRFWQAMEHKNEIDAEESDDIELVLEQGTLCLKIVEMILPIYHLYNKGVITFQEYQERVNLLMKSDKISSLDESQVPSIEENIPSIEEVSSGKE